MRSKTRSSPSFKVDLCNHLLESRLKERIRLFLPSVERVYLYVNFSPWNRSQYLRVFKSAKSAYFISLGSPTSSISMRLTHTTLGSFEFSSYLQLTGLEGVCAKIYSPPMEHFLPPIHVLGGRLSRCGANLSRRGGGRFSIRTLNINIS